MLTYPAPNPLNGDALIAELRAAGVIISDRGVTLNGAEITVDTTSPDTVVAPVVAAHTGQPTATQAARQARSSDAVDALTALIAQAGGAANVRTKLKAVLAGTDTFTNQQAQRLLAAVAIVMLRDRADT